MSVADLQQLALGALQGLASSTLFVLALFIGFCVVVGFTKLKKTAGGAAKVVKSLDERISHQPMVYLSPSAPHGPVDQLHAPELQEAAARKS
jgi:acid phosphatase family membrane protein YuiD